MEMKLPMEGGCRCGKSRFRVSKPALLTSACHCVGCQQMTASAFSLSVAVPADGFELLSGDVVVGGLHDPDQRHYHCEWCKSWIFTRVSFDATFVNVRATMLDDHTGFTPFAEFWTSEKLAWATTPAKHRFERVPPLETFGPLVAEFMAQAGRE